MLESSIEAQKTAELAAEAASPVNPDDADKGALDGSQVAGAGEAAGEGSSGEDAVEKAGRKFAEKYCLPLKGTIALLDGSTRVTSSEDMTKVLTQLISIRTDVARGYFAWETPANNDPSLQQLREYDMPGTAVKECHDIFRSKLYDVQEREQEEGLRRSRSIQSVL